MKYTPVITILLVLTGMILIAGCSQAPVLTPAATPSVTSTSIPTPALTLTPVVKPTTVVQTKNPEPVRTLPTSYAISVDVASNGLSISPKIIATYRGGMGANYIYEIEMIVTRGDGKTESGSIKSPLHVGDTIELDSSGGNTDSAEVWVTLQNGEKYKVFDELVPFRQFH